MTTTDVNAWPSAVLEAEGHLVDSQVLARIFDKVVERAGRFDVQQFTLGRTNDERSYLALNGCDELQGDLISKPLSATDFEAWVVGRRASVARV